MSDYQLITHQDYSKIAFSAMASTCEVLVRNLDKKFCHTIAKIVTSETKRIEAKFSRYAKDNLVYRMNHSNDQSVNIDTETFKLLEYARNLFELSDGLFDITSGVLREIWSFTPNSKPPTESEVKKILKRIGFESLHYDQQVFSMPKDMQIDFGGIGKEYAVDQISKMIKEKCQTKNASYLVNFGGDLSAVKFHKNDPDWIVGLESVNDIDQTASVIKISHGSVATSGNTKRFFEYQGKRYGHLLNPKTGYPIDDAPRSITAFSDSCVLAGSFSSLAMLQGKQAEKFLKDQKIKYICLW